MNVIVTVTNVLNSALVEFPVALGTALALKRILAVDGSNFTVQIQALKDGALKSADETLAMIDQWEKEHPAA